MDEDLLAQQLVQQVCSQSLQGERKQCWCFTWFEFLCAIFFPTFNADKSSHNTGLVVLLQLHYITADKRLMTCEQIDARCLASIDNSFQ